MESPGPAQPTWPDGRRSHIKLLELSRPTEDPDPKALACYGLLLRPGRLQADQMWLRFVDRAPRECGDDRFLAWCSAQLAAQGFTALLLIWDNASWHRSQAVRDWICDHNQQVKRGATGVRIVVCHLPSKSPWLNPIEPKGSWQAGRGGTGPAAEAAELEARVYADYGCERETHLVMPKKVA